MRKQRNLGPRHCLSTRLLFSNQNTIPRWGKKLYEITSNCSFYLDHQFFHKLIISLKICENSEFGVSNSLDNMMISPHCLISSSDSFTNLETTKLPIYFFFRKTEFDYLFFCTMNFVDSFCHNIRETLWWANTKKRNETNISFSKLRCDSKKGFSSILCRI